MTGLPFEKPESFTTWWRYAERRWAPPGSGKTDATTFRSEAWRFSIQRPKGEAWRFGSEDSSIVRIEWTGEAGSVEIDVRAHGALEGRPGSADEYARIWTGIFQVRFAKTTERKLFGRSRLGNLPAIEHECVGTIKEGRAVCWRALFAEKNGILYSLTVDVDAGASDEVGKAVNGIVASFRVLD